MAEDAANLNTELYFHSLSIKNYIFTLNSYLKGAVCELLFKAVS